MYKFHHYINSSLLAELYVWKWILPHYSAWERVNPYARLSPKVVAQLHILDDQSVSASPGYCKGYLITVILLSQCYYSVARQS